MNPEEIARSYDRIAERWRADVFPMHNGVSQHERALAFVSERGPALDVGCGASGRIVELLLRVGFDVEGIDVSERMLELARARHPQVGFQHIDVRAWLPQRAYHFISGWDSLWHLPLADQAPVLRKLMGALAPGGVLIFSTGGLDQAEEKRDEAMGVPMFYSVLGIPATLTLIDQSGCVCRHLEYDQHPEQHVYLIVQRRT